MPNENLNAKLKAHFDGLTDEDFQAFYAFTTERKVPKGSAVFTTGDSAEQFFVLASGIVEVINPDGSSFAEFIDGEVLGLFEFMTKAKYNATATAKTDCSVLAFPQDGKKLENFAEVAPKLYAKLIRSFLVFVARRTRKATRILKTNSPQARQIKAQLYTDKLTGVYNKTFLQENLKDLFTENTSLISFKLDNFKGINDRFGHKAGDAVLALVGKLLNENISDKSKIIRYEGNLFLVITKKQTDKEAYSLAEKIQKLIESTNLNAILGLSEDENAFTVELCLIVALFPQDNSSAERLILESVPLPVKALRNGKKGIILFKDGV
ncbi:MAG: GGDEF domain-containing protein [Treponemataceae bacterium]